MKKFFVLAALLAVLPLLVRATDAPPAAPAPTPAFTPTAPAPGVHVLDLVPVWSGHPVDFALLTHGDQQFVAFYDDQRQMTVGQRTLGNPQWKYKKLPSSVGWDSHNYITMTIDKNNCLHVIGNMHASKLVYFKADAPLDIDSLRQNFKLTDNDEESMTYPRFIKGPNDKLYFTYRNGHSGDGNTFIDVYEDQSYGWRHLREDPLFDGQNERNAYPIGPNLGPDGNFHVAWVWRETGDAETNHQLCYARSPDLERWYTIKGDMIDLPIRLSTPDVVVDPIPPLGGIINGSGAVGFDLNKNVVISYHKFDDAGNTQLYFARFENGEWKHYQATDWTYRWKFFGPGSLLSEITAGPLQVVDGKLAITIHHIKFGDGRYEVDPTTFKLGAKLPSTDTPLPDYLTKSKNPDMMVHWRGDLGQSPEGTTYRLRWETLGVNRDQPRPQPWPAPTMLQLVETGPKASNNP